MTNEERKVFELALEALLKTQNEGFNLPGSAIREAITAIKEALAQPKKLDQDEVDIRSRLYQRIHELETQLAQPTSGDYALGYSIGFGEGHSAEKALAQPEQEPVAWQVMVENEAITEFLIKDMAHDWCVHQKLSGSSYTYWIRPLYTTPPQRKEPEQEPSALYTKTKIEIGCSECGIGGGHALYCVRCAEKFVGGYKENVPVHASELLTQVSTDTQYAGNGTAGIQNETKSTGFFFQMPPQRTWVGLTNEEIDYYIVHRFGVATKKNLVELIRLCEIKLKEKNGI